MRLKSLPLLVVLCVAACSSQPETPGTPPPEGMYCSSGDDTWIFAWTFLELKQGKFRYWYETDVPTLNQREYPLTGDYSFRDGKLKLNNSKVYEQEWIADVVNGTPVLWRPKGLQRWREEKVIDQYQVVIKAEGKFNEWDGTRWPPIAEWPSIRKLESGAKQEKK